MKCFVFLTENKRHAIREDLERSRGLVFAHIDDMHARRVPTATVSPWSLPGECHPGATRTHDPPRRGHRALRIDAVIDSPEQIVHLARANLRFGVIERNGAAKAALRKFQPSPRLVDVTKNI